MEWRIILKNIATLEKVARKGVDNLKKNPTFAADRCKL